MIKVINLSKNKVIGKLDPQEEVEIGDVIEVNGAKYKVCEVNRISTVLTYTQKTSKGYKNVSFTTSAPIMDIGVVSFK